MKVDWPAQHERLLLTFWPVGFRWKLLLHLFHDLASVSHFTLDQNSPQNTPQAGVSMIAFLFLFIAAFASNVGPYGLGRCCRTLSFEVPGQMYGHFDCLELALKFSHRLLHNFYHSSHRLSVWICFRRLPLCGSHCLLLSHRKPRQDLGGRHNVPCGHSALEEQ